MNINENVNKLGKIVRNIHKLTNFRPKPSLMYVIISYVIQFDKLLYPVVLYEKLSHLHSHEYACKLEK